MDVRVLVLDPGETFGVANFRFLTGPKIELLEAYQVSVPIKKSKQVNWAHFGIWLEELYASAQPKLLVSEDFVLYGTRAMSQVGSRMLTSELLAVSEFVATTRGIKTVRISASLKGRWPKARLRTKFPQYFGLPQPHAADACLLGLAYYEMYLRSKGLECHF